MKTFKHALFTLLAVSAMGGMAVAQDMKKELRAMERAGHA